MAILFTNVVHLNLLNLIPIKHTRFSPFLTNQITDHAHYQFTIKPNTPMDKWIN